MIETGVGINREYAVRGTAGLDVVKVDGFGSGVVRLISEKNHTSFETDVEAFLRYNVVGRGKRQQKVIGELIPVRSI